MKITSISAREILDSRGNPTIEVIMTSGNASARFAVPSGASTGQHEAVEKRDGGKRYDGKGVINCVDTIQTEVVSQLVNLDVSDQTHFDKRLLEIDGTDNKSRLGGNTTLALSGAYARLTAVIGNKPLWQHLSELADMEPKWPRLYANLINGGAHAPGLDIQEFMVVPKEVKPGLATEEVVRFQQELKRRLQENFGPHSTTVGDEGGFVPQNINTWQVLDLFTDIANDLSLDVQFALDVAANHLAKEDQYRFGNVSYTPTQMKEKYIKMIERYSLISIEDPFVEDDAASFGDLLSVSEPCFIVGDDITVTNAEKIRDSGNQHVIDGVIIKPNQIGTITETLEAIKIARESEIKIIVSHRSGETNDDFIADLAYGVGAFGFKLGAPARGERVAKYNRLLAIEEET